MKLYAKRILGTLLGLGLILAIGISTYGALGQSRARAVRKLTQGIRVGAVPGGTLDPAVVPKYALPLVIPPAMPRTARVRNNSGALVDYYEIAVRQFKQRILPSPLPKTTVWGYGSKSNPATFNYPSFTIEARWNHPVRVKWINELIDKSGNYLPHLLPVDQTLMWANPPGGLAGRDSRGSSALPYTGPVPLVTHVHGAHVAEDSDGYALAWFLPAAKNIPAGYAREGSFYNTYKTEYKNRVGGDWRRGSATFEYSNDQRPATLWYHDHAMGMTRANVYAGPAGFYIIRGGSQDQDLHYRAPKLTDPAVNNITYTEIPIGIQDRSFNTDGSLFFPPSREFFDGFTGPYLPDPTSDISPIWNPEFFGNMMVVNGRTWPQLDVKAWRYRFRFLNGCNARFLILRLVTDNTPGDGIDDGNWTAIPGAFWQIGSEGGFLPAPVQQDQLLIANAERADTIIDFGPYAGQDLYLVNVGPDEPFAGGVSGVDFTPSDPASTGQVMRFRINLKHNGDPTIAPSLLSLPAKPSVPDATVTRQVSLNELDSALLPGVGPEKATLGLVDLSTPGTPAGIPMMFEDEITENPGVGTVEIWEIYNFTADAHPIHVHQTMFQVINREVFDPALPEVGEERDPEAWESGFKDTVIAYPGEITRIKARFDLPGLFVWHCHIVDHEDNEMMRPYYVGPIPAAVRRLLIKK
jgi:spore coat protein A, manganese oxidase